MMRPLFRSLSIGLPLCAVLFAGCKKEFDTPPERHLGVGDVYTIAQLRAMYVNNSNVAIQWRDSSDKSVYAVVTADERSGNLYRNVYVQDHTGSIVLRLKNPGGIYQGDSIRIHLPGTTLSAYQGLLQLDSVDVDNNIVKQGTGVHVEPRTVSIAQLGDATNLLSTMQGALIRLENVEFIPGDTAKTYANAVTQATENRTLKDCGSGTVIVRNSGYADFAGVPIPKGRGSFLGVVGVFGSTIQLFIRNVNEVQLNGPRCGENDCTPAARVEEDFGIVQNNAEVQLECWLNVFTEGSRRWRGRIADGQSSAEGSVASFDTQGGTAWLVSPPLTYSAGMALNFSSAVGSTWQHNGLSVWLSTDINLTNGATVTAAPWQAVNATLAGQTSGTGTWVPSGNIDLSTFVTEGQPFVIGFKYTGVPTTQATTYRIDNVVVR